MTNVRLQHDITLLTPERITHNERQARAAADTPDVAIRILALFPIWYEQVQRMAQSLTAGETGRRSSEVSDPTVSAVLSHDGALTEMDEGMAALAEWIAAGRTLEARFTRVRRVADAQTLAEVKDALRCTGGQGMPGNLVWGRPDCRENSLHGPLCGPCSHEQARWALSPADYTPLRRSDGRTGARPKWDALLAASHANLRAGLEQVIREAS